MPLLDCRYDSLPCRLLMNLISFRINGSGGYVTTVFWMGIPCRLVTFGGDCPLMSMLLLKGKMGNLLSLKVSLVFSTPTKHSQHFPF